MKPHDLTIRQFLARVLTGTAHSSRELAELAAISERQVEDHLIHIARSMARDRTRRFVLEPASCRGCGYVFRERTRLTRPSRCPRCRNEAITSPRYGIKVPVTQKRE